MARPRVLAAAALTLISGLMQRAGAIPYRAHFARAADWLVIAFVISIPWSTSASVALVVLWLFAVLPAIDWMDVRDSLVRPAAGLPVALFGLAVLAMFWGGASFADQIISLKLFIRLLVVPILFVQFRHSDRGMLVLAGFLCSCTVLLALSYIFWIAPSWTPWFFESPTVPAKDYVIQSVEFLLCAYALVHLSITAWHERRRGAALAMLLLALAFICNIVFVETARSTLFVFAALVPLVALQRFNWKGMVAVILAGAMLAGSAWASSPSLRSRVLEIADEIRDYQKDNAETSSGFRLEFWKKSLRFIAAAPVVGNGTGTIMDLFRTTATGERGPSSSVTRQPHNQTLTVAIQLGLLGTVLLYAFWLAHFLLFRGAGLAAWLGAGLVLQNVVSCLFNSYLFEFTLGWVYLFGVGVLGGMVLREKDAHRAEVPGP